jgi:hypothetical protein
MNNSTLSRIGNVEFFAVLPAGFYVFLVGYLVLSIDNVNIASTQTIWMMLEPLTKQMHQNPILLLFIIFCSYLLGSIIRTIPVSWAEGLTPPFTIKFPHSERLMKLLEVLNANADATLHDIKKVPKISGKVTMPVFHYWKDALCVYSPHTFAYYERFEARTRFFVGMFWAGAIGLLGSIIMFVRIQNLLFEPAWYLFIMSTILIFSFGLSIHRVRRQETYVLFWCYVAFLQTVEQPNKAKGNS